MFDSAEPASFRQAVSLVVGLSGRAGDSLPFVLIAAKDDLGMSNVSINLLFLCYYVCLNVYHCFVWPGLCSADCHIFVM
jgi:hypothetical protein